MNEYQSIELKPVESSQIHAIGHHPESNTLAVQFKGKDGTPGSIYHYQNFNADQFAQFSSAESIGSHFYKHIKPFTEKHPYTKILPPAPQES